MATLKTDIITNLAGNGSPTFPYGAVTNSYSAGVNGGETLSATGSNVKTYDPSGSINVTLDNSWAVGKEFIIAHLGLASSTALITLRANDNSVIATIYPKMTYKCMPISAPATTTTHWIGLTSIESDWIAYTPVVSNLGTGSLSINQGYYKRRGGSVSYVIYSVKDGSVGTGTSIVYWSYPSGHVLGSGRYPTDRKGGLLLAINSSFGYGSTGIALPTTSGMLLVRDTAGNGFRGQDWSAGAEVAFNCDDFPISGWSQTKG